MVAKTSLGVAAALLLIPLMALTGTAVIALLVAVLWMSGVHTLLRRADLGRHPAPVPAAAPSRRTAGRRGAVSSGENRFPS